MGSDEREAVAAGQQVEEVEPQLGGGGVDDPLESLGLVRCVHRASTSAAVWTSREIGQIVIPSAAARSSPPTSGMRVVKVLV